MYYTSCPEDEKYEFSSFLVLHARFSADYVVDTLLPHPINYPSQKKMKALASSGSCRPVKKE